MTESEINEQQLLADAAFEAGYSRGEDAIEKARQLAEESGHSYDFLEGFMGALLEWQAEYIGAKEE